jgi:hypothetical protein
MIYAGIELNPETHLRDYLPFPYLKNLAPETRLEAWRREQGSPGDLAGEETRMGLAVLRTGVLSARPCLGPTRCAGWSGPGRPGIRDSRPWRGVCVRDIAS